ncbi:MAG: hypothetical protein U9Q83_03040 [Bacteroidota bacterium]|nr:hypothetical protein [Bacteroidota bacterium]
MFIRSDMQFKLFTVPINNINDFNDELNSFLQNNKINVRTADFWDLMIFMIFSNLIVK